MPAPSAHRIQRHSVEGLRVSDVPTLAVLVPEALRLHVQRIEPACVADLFALSELGLAGTIGAELGQWAAKATREIRDLPDGPERAIFVQEIGELEPGMVPRRMRDAILALESMSSAETSSGIRAIARTWEDTPPSPIVLPQAKAKPKGEAKVTTPRAPAKPRVAKTPAAMVDPRRAEWVREDSVTRLASREYQERGLKENIFLAGIKHRSPYKDLTDEEIKVELRKLERERKLKHTGERWLIR